MVRLDGELIERGAIRFTPSGVPVLDCRLRHRSEQIEAGLPRSIDFEIAAVALGDLVATVDRITPGMRLEVDGFLAPSRKGSRSLTLHITSCRPQDGGRPESKEH
ncbi:MAG: primosomal replication protein N [Burkholderiaceae bacterium]